MNHNAPRMRPARRLGLALIALLTFASAAPQQAAAQDAPPLLDDDALVDLVAPVALYPDDLLAIVLPASTYPLQVVEAARFLEERESDPGLEPDPGWDDSIVALLNYPEALQLLNDDLDWTWQLGEAVLAQQADVLEAVELFRDEAWLAGNLKSDDRQVVERADEGIVIRPRARDVIYVPYYDPDVVVVRSAWPVYHYHPYAYPLYYYPYPVGHRFRADYFWGVSTAFAISWRSRFLHLHYFDHVGHPFYGYRYYPQHRYYRHRRAADYRVYRDGVRVVHRRGQAFRWHPRSRHGARPGYRRFSADRNRATLRYDDRGVRHTNRTKRAARVNRERQRYRTFDNVIDRERRNVRRDRTRDRADAGGTRRQRAAGERTRQRFAAGGERRRGASRTERGARRGDAASRTRVRGTARNGGNAERRGTVQRRDTRTARFRSQRDEARSGNRAGRSAPVRRNAMTTRRNGDASNRSRAPARASGQTTRRLGQASSRRAQAAPRQRAGNRGQRVERAPRAERPRASRSAPRAQTRSRAKSRGTTRASRGERGGRGGKSRSRSSRRD